MRVVSGGAAVVAMLAPAGWRPRVDCPMPGWRGEGFGGDGRAGGGGDVELGAAVQLVAQGFAHGLVNLDADGGGGAGEDAEEVAGAAGEADEAAGNGGSAVVDADGDLQAGFEVGDAGDGRELQGGVGCGERGGVDGLAIRREARTVRLDDGESGGAVVEILARVVPGAAGLVAGADDVMRRRDDGGGRTAGAAGGEEGGREREGGGGAHGRKTGGRGHHAAASPSRPTARA